MTRRHAFPRSGRLLLACERALLALGCLSAGIYGVSIALSSFYQGEAGRAFDRSIRERGAAAAAPEVPFSRPDLEAILPSQGGLTAPIVDMSEWSAAKARRYEGRLVLRSPPALARLQIPSLGLSAMVLEGTSESSLLLGIGHIAGTSRPGEGGNVGLAGHRDSFFRGLSRIAPDAEIVLTTLEGRDLRYSVDSIEVVEPERVEVLAPAGSPRLTLVTCYPFYYLGPAPLRFVVTATLEEDRAAGMVAVPTPAQGAMVHESRTR